MHPKQFRKRRTTKSQISINHIIYGFALKWDINLFRINSKCRPPVQTRDQVLLLQINVAD